MKNPTIFISYSHKDEVWRDRLCNQLSVYAKQDLLNFWHDRQISAGEEWHQKIQEAINTASIAILLISENFLTSDFIQREEVPSFLQRRASEGMVIFPVIIRHCAWDAVEWLSALQVRPKDGKPLEAEKGARRNKALLDIAREAYKIFQDINAGNDSNVSFKLPDSSPSEIEPYPFKSLTVEYVSRQRLETAGDLLDFLKEKLSPGSGVKLMILSGLAGMGKTVSAQEAVKALESVYKHRVIWVGAQGDQAVTFSEVVDTINRRLQPGSAPPPDPENRKHKARFLLKYKSTLIAIDDFESMSLEEQESCVKWLNEEPYNTVLLISKRAVIPEIEEQINAREVTGEMTHSEAKEFWNRLINRGAINKHVLAQRSPEYVVENYSRNPFILLKGVYMSVQVHGTWKSPEEVLSDKDVAQRVFRCYLELRIVGDEGSAILLALSLFTPHASREALMYVAGITDQNSFAESLGRLVTLLLISPSPIEGRYELDKIYLRYAREYMKESPLAAGLRTRFVDYFVRYIELHADSKADDLNAIEAEKDNIFEAFRLAHAENDLQSLMSMLAVLGRLHDGFFEYRGYWDAALKYSDLALEAAKEQGFNDKEMLAQLTCFAASLRLKRARFEEARELLRPLVSEGVSLSRQTLTDALHLMGMVEFSEHKYPIAKKFFHRELALSEEEADGRINWWGVANATQELGRIARVTGDFEPARRFFERSRNARENLKNPDGTPQIGATKSALHDLGLTAHRYGEWEQLHGNDERARELYEDASSYYQDAYELKFSLGLTNSLAHTLTEMAELERLRAGQEASPRKRAARYRQAHRWLMQSLEIKEKQGDELHMAYTNYVLGRIAVDKGDMREARRRWKLSRDTSVSYGDRGGITGCNYLEGLIAEQEGEKADAAQLFRVALDAWEGMGLIAAKYARAALVRVSGTS